MKLIATNLQQAIAAGIHHIGQIAIWDDQENQRYILCHENDTDRSKLPDFDGLQIYPNASDARELALFSEDHHYRFSKAENSLQTGWVMVLNSIEELRLALDHFYPAAVGVWLAEQSGNLAVQNLRDKLQRQTGMYRSAKFISDDGVQILIEQTCGPKNRCAKKILWNIADNTPVRDSEASRFNGISSGLPSSEAIPLLCCEACNHFVSQCRKVSKAERIKAEELAASSASHA